MTPQDLLRVLPSAGGRASVYAGPLTEAMREFAIDTPRRQAAFIAQIAHESGSLRYSKELWGPTPAQKGYEGRPDLGNSAPGDGKRFMGRGLIQITGRANYAKCGGALGLPLLVDETLLEAPGPAARSAGWYWHVRNLNKHADVDAFGALTRAINGGFNGLDHRIAHWLVARAALGVV